jgi:serine/threonine protein kinase
MTEPFGSWQLDGVIAVGGLGEIWRARRGDEAVALKRLHSHLLRNDDIRAQFGVEQRLTTELPRHPNVVHAVEAGTVTGRPYIALEVAPGDDLRRQLAPPAATRPGPGDDLRRAFAARPGLADDLRRPPAARAAGDDAAEPARVVLPRARVRAIAIAACDAAAHIHDHGFAHGDINPGNLVVSVSDQVTLIDLGIARELGRAGAVRGTHAYMAPEQVRAEPWTAATDVFALGVVLWELVAGARLFHRGPPWLTVAAVMEAAVPALDDPALDAIAQAALAKDPGRRLASASELADRLRAL